MKKGKGKCSTTPEFISGVKGTTKKYQPNNHIPNQKKTRKVVV